MSDFYRLAHQGARQRAAQRCQSAPEGWEVRFKEPTRNSDQNAKFHAICSDLAKSGALWRGKKRTAKNWKILLVSAHSVATGEETEMEIGLEGEVVNLRESTALMSVRRSSSLIEYALAFCAMHDVLLSEPEREYA